MNMRALSADPRARAHVRKLRKIRTCPRKHRTELGSTSQVNLPAAFAIAQLASTDTRRRALIASRQLSKAASH